ncbi:hypothetical protein FHS16_003560 [Paenibacillus endophyticus]|uniref:Transcobalamin-like C-terminal domain-containing protein n=1 Tax=Paenibacillus endophyticus TaxID=1294268 RepID=A0A7W5C992_9BACL|nr:DUF4430 domain-containing protein [Paenibacillus endophyticus]MBB3153498.1 hypothetical protein [Paenibacillus endophyticus]
MSRNKWLAALVIAGVLAIAFFWGGNYPKKDMLPAPSETLEAAATQSAQPAEAEQSSAPSSSTPLPSGKAEPEESVMPAASPADDMTTQEQTETKPEQTKAVGGGEAAATEAPTKAPIIVPTKAPAVAPTKAPVKATSEPAQAKPGTGKDKYQTDPVPKGKPKPVEWQDATIDKSEKLTVTLSVRADTILSNMDLFNEDKLEVLPKDGIIYKTQKVTFYEGESVFDVLLREMKKSKIHMEFEMTPVYNSNYIEGIHNIYEFDCGELSGWMYKVNGWFPNYGSSRYMLKDGDVIDWVYTCDLGRDVGGDNAAGAKP